MIKGYFIFVAALLAYDFASPTADAYKKLTIPQIDRKAHIIVQKLKKEDPRVLRSVMYKMGWVPRLEFKREKQKRKQCMNTLNRLVH